MSALARLFAALAAVVFALSAVVAARRSVVAPRVVTEGQAPAMALRSVDPVATPIIAGLQTRSPFAVGRGAYQRVIPAAAPQAPPPSVRLVAIFSIGGEPRATLRIDGVDHTVGVGDVTPAGTVTAIESEAVELAGETAQRVSLFE